MRELNNAKQEEKRDPLLYTHGGKTAEHQTQRENSKISKVKLHIHNKRV